MGRAEADLTPWLEYFLVWSLGSLRKQKTKHWN